MKRDKSLDFVKFVYVAMMITYHCFYMANYDQSFHININRYLTYVSGSFPFMAGYFVSAYYLKNLEHSSELIFKRLFIRGFKLILMYFLFNLIFIYAINDYIDLNVISKSDNPVESILMADPRRVIYDILYSLGIVLIFGAMLTIIYTKIISRSNLATLIILASILSIMIYTDKSILITCGIIGIIAGLSPIKDLTDMIYRKKSIIIVSYLFGLLAAIFSTHTKKDMILYILCVYTLFFSLKHSYKYLQKHVDKSELIDLFSQYSLFIYLFHVIFLVVITKILLKILPTINPLLLFAILLSLVIYASVIVTRELRTANENNKRLSTIIYRLIFN